MHYATLHQVRQYLKLESDETADDELLKRFIREAVNAIDERCRRRFDAYYDTLVFDYPLPEKDRIGVYAVEDFVYQMNAVARWSQQVLRIFEDLLEPVTITNGDDADVSLDDVVLEPANSYPKRAIRIKQGSGERWAWDSAGNRFQVISVAGYWGYHTRYGDAWSDSLDTVRDDPLTIAATSLEVSDADGTDSDTLSPRFQVGQMLKIEDECLFVVETNTTTNVLTVTRGYNGTTAAAHVQGTAVYVFRPMDKIVRACSRLVVWAYRQKDSDAFDKATILGTGIAITPSTMPADVRELLPRPKPLRLND